MVVKFSELKPKLDTGDLFLFSANFLISRIIQVVTHSAYSHVGMVARYPDADGKLCFWECTTFNQLVDKADHELHSGVRLVSLDKLLAIYANYVPGGFSVRLLKADRTPDFREAFANYVKLVDARPIANDLAMMARWMSGKMLSLTATDSSFFCSQLIAETYQRVGLLPEHRPPNAYAPKDFSMQNTNLQLLSGATLSEEIFVEWDGAKKTVAATA
ncbi:MAG TPA: hypothetical protein VEV17_18085 [Bryobacteraceae bacterium]|nr:hypothetical protein [Bryobacteraceae bacterium]